MKTQFLSVLLMLVFSAAAFGWGGEVTTPSIGCRADLAEEQKKKLERIFDYMQDDLKFIKGMFVNEYTQQQFGGSSAQVAHFIDLLKGAGLWKVQVGFHDLGNQNVAFNTGQTSPDSVSITVNSGREDFLLKDFARHLPAPETAKDAVPKLLDIFGKMRD